MWISQWELLEFSGCSDLAASSVSQITGKKADSEYHLYRGYSCTLKVNGLEDKSTGLNLDELQAGFIELVLSFKYLTYAK